MKVSQQYFHIELFIMFSSQFTSRMTSISENEMNIQIPLCNVQPLNGIVKISFETFHKKDVLTEKKNQNTWETITFCEIFRE